MTTPIGPSHQAFPLTPPGGRYLHSNETPSGPDVRPWALRFATVPDSTGAVAVPACVYDQTQQVSLASDGGLLTCMANTHTPTVPDGDPDNPPPLDEGPKD
ncbi:MULTISPECIES: putative ATP-grasp-modified RiPP [Streptacidiphilus]|uniref:ATP-grasp-modified RiPP n=1 Tax=Streptacidiphilus cavernicola TaxID=3342716 RepID=A0ABV6UWC1_9ACTN|nr:putative ATP-grasp-modified RiPP [Streptacidiphilus jeojiense]